MKRQAENFHVVVGMTRLIKMPSYWFGDVLAVVQYCRETDTKHNMKTRIKNNMKNNET